MNQPATTSDDNRNPTSEERRQAQSEQNRALITLLDAWVQEDPQEQRETLETLVRALDEDRPSSRKFFAP